MSDDTDATVEPSMRVSPGGRARWSRLALIGSSFVVAGPLLMIIAGLITGVDVPAFFLIVTAIAAIGLFLGTRRPIPVRIAGAVLSLLAGMAMFWTIFGLASMSSFFDFVPGLLMLPGALLAVGATIASVVAHRRGHFVTESAGVERQVIIGVLGVVLILVVGSGVLSATGRSTADASQADQVVRMKNFEFEPSEVSAQPGDTLLIRNNDPFLHTFNVKKLGINLTVGPGSSKLVTIPDDADAEEYILYCEPHTGSPDDPDSDDMAGTLKVT